MSGIGYWCKVSVSYNEKPCEHVDCMIDPAVRVSDDTLYAIATTCSSQEMRLHAEMTLRKRYPSKVKLPKAEEPPLAQR